MLERQLWEKISEGFGEVCLAGLARRGPRNKVCSERLSARRKSYHAGIGWMRLNATEANERSSSQHAMKGSLSIYNQNSQSPQITLECQKFFSNLLLEELVLLSLLQTELSFSVVELQRGLREFYWLGRTLDFTRAVPRHQEGDFHCSAEKFLPEGRNSRVGVEGQATLEACVMHAFYAEAQQDN